MEESQDGDLCVSLHLLKWTPMLLPSSSFILSASLDFKTHIQNKMAAMFRGTKEHTFSFYHLCQTRRQTGYTEDRKVKLDNRRS